MKAKKEEKEQEKKEPKQPAAVYRDGQIKATCWERDGEYGKLYSVVIKRSYQKDDEWQETDNFDRRDILSAARCLEKIYDAIVESRGHGLKFPPFGKDKEPDKSDAE